VPWTELALELDSAAAEAFADALLEAGAHSVALEPGAGEAAARTRLSAIVALERDPAALAAAAARSAGLAAAPPLRLGRIEDQDWVRRAQSQFAPIAIGARLAIAPSWSAAPPGAEVVVRIDPGTAFGTGGHASTLLALRFLERRVRGGERVLDYGCGSGILAIAAAKLGAAQCDAVDVDPQALEAAAGNARANRVALRVAAPEALAPARYDIVVSNILAQPLIVLAPLLAARVAPRGRLALSGLLEAQAREVAQAYAPWLELAVSAAEEGWALLEGVRR
jgi:ribosomal protein L11 methyltransferase